MSPLFHRGNTDSKVPRFLASWVSSSVERPHSGSVAAGSVGGAGMVEMDTGAPRGGGGFVAWGGCARSPDTHPAGPTEPTVPDLGLTQRRAGRRALEAASTRSTLRQPGPAGPAGPAEPEVAEVSAG